MPGASGLARGSGALASPLLERDADVAQLRALVDDGAAGNGRLLVIEASAGIGKTRLLTEARSLAVGAGMRVLTARGAELEREFAFGLVRQLFEPMLATASVQERAELFAGAAALSAPLFGGELADAPAADASFAILHGLYWLAINAALGTPTLLVLDDLHWGDRPSLRWLSYVTRRLEGMPLVLAAATRPASPDSEAPLLDEVLTDPTALVLRPGVLGPESVAALARETFETVPEAEFCAACHQATGGNPLYLQALLVALVAEGVTPTAASTARVDDVGPQPVARAVALRLSRLSPAAGALARAVAILGQSADLELAATLTGLDHLTAITAAGDLMRAELLRSDTGLEFTHPVVRAAVYDKLAPAERADAHRRAAGLLTEAGAEPEQAASHLLLAPSTGDAQVVSVLRTAAASLSSRGAGSEAMVFLRRALAEPPPDDQRADVLTELGMVESLVDFPASIEHFREATELTDDPGRLAAVTLACGRTLGLTGANTAEAIEMLRAAIDQAGTEHVELREEATAHLVGAAWHERDFYPVAREFLDALDENELAGGLGTDMLRATLAHDELRRGADRDRTISLAERSLASGAIEGITAQSIYYALDALRAGEAFGPALAGYERALATARRRGDLLNVGGLLGFRGWLLIEQGDLRAAESDIREGIGFATDHGAPIHRMYLAVFLSDFLRERGELEDAERALSALELGERVPETFPFTFFLLTRGKLRLAQRAVEAALADFSAIERIAEGLGLRNPAEWPWRSGMARALHAVGRDREAYELADEELVIARGWGAGRPIGVALRTLSVLEEGAAGERRLRDAVDVLAGAPARLEHAKALIELGSALRRRNQRSAARELLREGVELGQRCGATAVVAHGNDELAATGARPRNVVVGGVDSLTASERRVAQLASEEMTNKAIAQELFVTVKTVEVHLSSVYRKLDIGSRRQLAGAILAPAQAAGH